MTTFQITNTKIDFNTNTAIVFYLFSNGETNNEKFIVNASLKKNANNWGISRALWFDERDIELANMLEESRLAQELLINPIEE